REFGGELLWTAIEHLHAVALVALRGVEVHRDVVVSFALGVVPIHYSIEALVLADADRIVEFFDRVTRVGQVQRNLVDDGGGLLDFIHYSHRALAFRRVPAGYANTHRDLLRADV